MKKALIIGGGAPNSTLMSGALLAFEENGISFDVITASGAGVLIGLLYLASKGTDAAEAMKRTTDFGVVDPIYNLIRINYKVFQKPGGFADLYRGFLQTAPEIPWPNSGFPGESLQRFLKDWMDLVFAVCCPTDLNFTSRGLCAHLPFLEEIIDFRKLKKARPEFYINAYNITDHKMEIFHKKEITPEHVHASLSFPFLYPPYLLNGKQYIEGAVMDCLNYKGLLEKHPETELIVVFDVLGSDYLIQPPRDLFDAWVKSMIIPLVEIARDDTKIFEYKHNIGKNKRKLVKVKFDIPEDYWPNVLEWSESNMEILFRIGYEAGIQCIDDHESELRSVTS